MHFRISPLLIIMENQPQPKEKSFNAVQWISTAIIVGSVLVSGSILYARFFSSNSDKKGNNLATKQQNSQNAKLLDLMTSVSANDHIRGNPDAPVKIVEYSDTECPFCKSFHSTMKQIMDEYGKPGKVAWVYRHFPLTQIHPKATKEAEALECANELGGNDKFWEYTDRIFEITPSNNNLNPEELLKIAQYLGLDTSKFKTCLDSGKYAQHVKQDAQNAAATGGGGTPWSIVVAKNEKKYPLAGAQSYNSVKQLIELVLQEK